HSITAVYGGDSNFNTSTPAALTQTVNKAATTTAAASQTATFSSSVQTVSLSAAVTSGAGTVSQGSVTFTVKDGTTIIGTATSGTLAKDSSEVSYSLHAVTRAVTYTIMPDYRSEA